MVQCNAVQSSAVQSWQSFAPNRVAREMFDSVALMYGTPIDRMASSLDLKMLVCSSLGELTRL